MLFESGNPPPSYEVVIDIPEAPNNTRQALTTNGSQNRECENPACCHVAYVTDICSLLDLQIVPQCPTAYGDTVLGVTTTSLYQVEFLLSGGPRGVSGVCRSWPDSRDIDYVPGRICYLYDGGRRGRGAMVYLLE